jgi:hypothetical protein
LLKKIKKRKKKMSKNFATNKLKIRRKHLSAAVALALTLTIAATFIIALPIASGQFLPDARESFAYAVEFPNPVGKGQSCVITGWVYPPPAVSGEPYYNFTYTITKPDGTKETRLIPVTVVDGTATFNYVPDQVGNYTVVLSFPGDFDHLLRTAAVSAPYVFTVTEEPFPIADYTALPSWPWSYPVSEVNQEWFRISGGWLKNYGNGYSGYAYNTPGPETAHILWKMPVAIAGLIGGEAGHEGITRPSFPPTGQVVGAMGRIYFTDDGGLTSDNPTGAGTNATMTATQFDRVSKVWCIDQYTGKVLWKTPLPYINYTTGQRVTAAQSGGTTLQIVQLSGAAKGGGPADSYALWASGGGLWKIDPLTGNVLQYQLTPALSPSYFDGNWYINNYPVQGNFSCISYSSIFSARPTIIWQKNVSQTGIAMNALLEGYIVQNLYDRTTGLRKLITWDAYTGDLVANGTYGGYYASDGSNPVYGNGVYSVLGADGRTRAWSFKTGSLLWTSEPMEGPFGTLGNYQGSVGYGIVMGHSYDHAMYAYNVTTGALVWRQDTSIDNPYNYEYASGGPPTWGYAVLADNKVYYSSGEHSPASPTERGDCLYCIDVNTGELIFRLPYVKGERSFWGYGISCGMLWAWNQYDGCLYMIGKGVSKTTVSASSGTITEGDSVLIQGHVTDLSSGTETLAERFPDGVPAVADDGMSDWMAYLYTIGTTGPWVNLDNVKGVNVTLTALGSDGSTVGIGDVTADRDGHFSYMWSPPSADCVYTVLASFDGGKSYYSSYGETSLGVTAAPQVPTPVPPEAPVNNTPMFIGSTAAIIIAIAIVAVLLLRKRP